MQRRARPPRMRPSCCGRGGPPALVAIHRLVGHGAQCLCCRQDNPGAASVARELQLAAPNKLRLVPSSDSAEAQLQTCTHFLLVLNRRTFVVDTDPTRPGEALKPRGKPVPWLSQHGPGSSALVPLLLGVAGGKLEARPRRPRPETARACKACRGLHAAYSRQVHGVYIAETGQAAA